VAINKEAVINKDIEKKTLTKLGDRLLPDDKGIDKIYKTAVNEAKTQMETLGVWTDKSEKRTSHGYRVSYLVPKGENSPVTYFNGDKLTLIKQVTQFDSIKGSLIKKRLLKLMLNISEKPKPPRPNPPKPGRGRGRRENFAKSP
jgi:hypothetical protein